MKALVFRILDRLRTSFWFVPLLMAVAALLLAAGSLALDRSGAAPFARLLDPFLQGGPDAARQLLATIAASMVTVTGVVFSVTIVALSLASQQFGPRILRNFMRDRGNQLVLGTFIATFLYCIIALMNVGREAEDLPHLTIFGAVFLTLLSLSVLIFFIHHVSVSIQAESVIRNVYLALDRSIRNNYPDRLGAGGRARAEPVDEPSGPHLDVSSPKSGYIEQVDHEALVRLAERHDCLVRLLHRPGKYVVAEQPLFRVWGAPHEDGRFSRRLQDAVAIGRRRTDFQDPEFLIDELVEIAVRALSIGVNDPFTASACIDRLSSALCLLGDRAVPSAVHRRNGRLRLIAPPNEYEGLVKAALSRLRQHGASSAGVSARLLEAIASAAERTHDAARRATLREHAERIMRSARAAGHDKDDLADLEERRALVERLVTAP